jgi:small-conductance mechanosensitive channel
MCSFPREGRNMSNTKSEKSPPTMREGLVEFVLVIGASVAVGIFTYILRTKGMLPEIYVQPIYAAIILVGGYVGTRVITTLIGKIASPAFGATRGKELTNFFEITAALLIILAISAIFQFSLTGFLVGAGFLGIVLGLAAQQVLGNIFAGISMVFSKPFELGDRITLINSSYSIVSSTYDHESGLNGYTGVVKDIGIFYTRVQLDDGSPSVFPNAVVVGSLVVNHSKVVSKNVRVRMNLDKGISFDEFRGKLLTMLRQEESGLLVPDRTTIDVIGVGTTTYQIVISVWAKDSFEDPIKTTVIQQALEVEKTFSAPKNG